MNIQDETRGKIKDAEELSSETSAKLLKELALQSYTCGYLEEAICLVRAALVYDEYIYKINVETMFEENFLEVALIDILIARGVIDSNRKVQLTAEECIEKARAGLRNKKILEALSWTDKALKKDKNIMKRHSDITFPETIMTAGFVLDFEIDSTIERMIEKYHLIFSKYENKCNIVFDTESVKDELIHHFSEINKTYEHYDFKDDMLINVVLKMECLECLKWMEERVTAAKIVLKYTRSNCVLEVLLFYSHFDSIKYLLEKIKYVNQCDENGKTPLMFVSEYGYFEGVKILLRRGAVVDLMTSTGVTAFMFASEMNHALVMNYLMMFNADPDRRDIYGMSAYLLTIKERRLEAENVLLFRHKHPSVYPALVSPNPGSHPIIIYEKPQALDYKNKAAQLIKAKKEFSAFSLLEKALMTDSSILNDEIPYNSADYSDDHETGGDDFLFIKIFNNEISVRVLLDLERKSVDYALCSVAQNNVFIIKQKDEFNLWEEILAARDKVIIDRKKIPMITLLACLGYLNLMKWVLSKKADPLLSEQHSKISPFRYALEFGHLKIVEYLRRIKNATDIVSEDNLDSVDSQILNKHDYSLLRGFPGLSRELEEVVISTNSVSELKDIEIRKDTERVVIELDSDIPADDRELEEVVITTNPVDELKDVVIREDTERVVIELDSDISDDDDESQLKKINFQYSSKKKMLVDSSKKEMLEALAQIESNEDRQAVINEFRFENVSTVQWGVIADVYSSVKFSKLNLSDAESLDGKTLKVLLRNSAQLYRLRIGGNCLLNQSDLRDIITEHPELRYLYFSVNTSFKELSGRLFSLSVNLVNLELWVSDFIQIKLDAPVLLTAKISSCQRLKSLKLVADKMKYMILDDLVSLETVEIKAPECALDVYSIGLSRDTESEWKKYFQKCTVKRVEGIHLHKKRCNVSVLSVMRDGYKHSDQCGLSEHLSSQLYMTKQKTFKFFPTPPSREYRSSGLMPLHDPDLECESFEPKERSARRYDLEIMDVNLQSVIKSNINDANVVIFSISYDSIADMDMKMALDFIENHFETIKHFFSVKPIFICVATIFDHSKLKFMNMLDKFVRQHNMLGPILINTASDVGIEELINELKEAVIYFGNKRYYLETDRGTLEFFLSTLYQRNATIRKCQLDDIFRVERDDDYRLRWLLNNIDWVKVDTKHQEVIWNYLGNADDLTIANLKRVKRLNLDNSKISTTDFVEILTFFQNLTHLTCAHCSMLEGNIFYAIITACHNIEEIDLSFTNIFVLDWRMPLLRLRHLNLNNCRWLERIIYPAVNLVSLKTNDTSVKLEKVDLGDEASPYLETLELNSFKGKLHIIAPNLRYVEIDEYVKLSEASVPTFEAVVKKYQNSTDPKEKRSAECCQKALNRMKGMGVNAQSQSPVRLFRGAHSHPGAPSREILLLPARGMEGEDDMDSEESVNKL